MYWFSSSAKNKVKVRIVLSKYLYNHLFYSLLSIIKGEGGTAVGKEETIIIKIYVEKHLKHTIVNSICKLLAAYYYLL